MCLNNYYIRLSDNGLVRPAIFLCPDRENGERERERKGGLGVGSEAEAYIWVIGVDRPWIIPPDNSASERQWGGQTL